MTRNHWSWWISTQGRATRTDFFHVLLYTPFAVFFGVVAFAWARALIWPFPIQFLGGGLILAAALVFLTALARRLHDIGRTGLWLVLWLSALAAAASLSHPIALPGADVQPWHVVLCTVLLPLVALAAIPPSASERFGADPRGPRSAPPLDPVASQREAQKLREKVQSMALPTLLMRPAEGSAFSKLGGKPELPASMEWPYGREHARCFLAQLDLAEVRAGSGPDWLPAEGRLYFFYDEDALDGLDLVACYASREPAGPERSAPDGYEPDPMFGERRVTFDRLSSIPSLEWLGISGSGLANADFDELAEAPDKPFGDGPQHRIGGYASEIQSAQMELECEFRSRGVPENYLQIPPSIAEGAKDWRLLLQVDSDDELSMNWIDTGRLYVFIREQDARAGDFSKTATISQFY